MNIKRKVPEIVRELQLRLRAKARTPRNSDSDCTPLKDSKCHELTKADRPVRLERSRLLLRILCLEVSHGKILHILHRPL